MQYPRTIKWGGWRREIPDAETASAIADEYRKMDAVAARMLELWNREIIRIAHEVRSAPGEQIVYQRSVREVSDSLDFYRGLRSAIGKMMRDVEA